MDASLNWAPLGQGLMRAEDASGAEWTLFPERTDVARLQLACEPVVGTTREEAVSAYFAALKSDAPRDEAFRRLRMAFSSEEVGYFATLAEGKAMLDRLAVLDDEALAALPTAEDQLLAAGFVPHPPISSEARFMLRPGKNSHSGFDAFLRDGMLHLVYEPARGGRWYNLLRLDIFDEGKRPNPLFHHARWRLASNDPMRAIAFLAVGMVELRMGNSVRRRHLPAL